jgi:hypothetical protein
MVVLVYDKLMAVRVLVSLVQLRKFTDGQASV